MDRRKLLRGLCALPFLGACEDASAQQATPATAHPDYAFSPEQWRQRLSRAQFDVLREHGTERAGSSPLNREHRTGTFYCAGCDNRLFSSGHKFDSGTGWPSFYQPITPAAVGTTVDRAYGMTRTEVHCARCVGHLGHIFDDGPRPTGKRYCINGVSLVFRPS